MVYFGWLPSDSSTVFLSFYLVVEEDLRYTSMEASPHFFTSSFSSKWFDEANLYTSHSEDLLPLM